MTQASTPADASPVRLLTLSVSNAPASGLYAGVAFTASGLQTVELTPVSESAAEVRIVFKPGAMLPDGIYNDTVHIRVCRDQECNNEVAGSPLTVTTSYTIASANSVSIDKTSVALTVPGNSGLMASETATITVAGPPATNALHVVPNHTLNGITSIVATPLSNTQTRVDFHFGVPSQKNPGTYADTVTLRVCYDYACTREVTGSPFSVTTSYTVSSNAQPEPGLTPLAVSSRTALAHNVIDAEYSKALNAVVMVSTWPQSALHVYDPATGGARQMLLNKPPKAVSISPDGTKAAVGHDALVTYVDLATAGTAGAAAPRLLNVSADVGDLVLDGRGVVHVFPATDQWVNVHSINVATNTETQRWGPYAGARARLHPAGDNIYAADTGLSPSDIENYDITSGEAVLLGDSPYHGDYPMCGDLWFSEDGATIYTACGKTFRASTERHLDMVYTGSLTLGSSTYGYRVVSLSQSAASKEVALIEQSWYECQPYANQPAACVSHLNLYDSDFLNLTGQYSIPPVSIAAASYAQRGLFVFHRIDGGKVLLSRLVAAPDPAAEYYLSLLP